MTYLVFFSYYLVKFNNLTTAPFIFFLLPVQTMQRVIAGGAPQDDIKVLHMSLKLAKICEEKQKSE